MMKNHHISKMQNTLFFLNWALAVNIVHRPLTKGNTKNLSKWSDWSANMSTATSGHYVADITMAEALELLRHHIMALHAVVTSATGPRPEKVQRPKVSMAINTTDWNYFTQHWVGYKTACNLTGNDIPQQLIKCCDDKIHHDLYRHMGSGPNGKTKEDLLTAFTGGPGREHLSPG
jgi:hypothetical protein